MSPGEGGKWETEDKEGKRGHLFNFTFNVFFVTIFERKDMEEERGHLFNYTLTFNVMLCMEKVF